MVVRLLAGAPWPWPAPGPRLARAWPSSPWARRPGAAGQAPPGSCLRPEELGLEAGALPWGRALGRGGQGRSGRGCQGSARGPSRERVLRRFPVGGAGQRFRVLQDVDWPALEGWEFLFQCGCAPATEVLQAAIAETRSRSGNVTRETLLLGCRFHFRRVQRGVRLSRVLRESNNCNWRNISK